MSSQPMLQMQATDFRPSLFDPQPEVGVFIPRFVPLPTEFDDPPAPPSRVLEDRWYQTKALAEIERLFPKGGTRRNGLGELLVSPTGCGKTSIASRAIKQWQDRKENTLILVDLDRLLSQMYDDLEAEDITPLIEQGPNHALHRFSGRGDVVLASVQSLYPERMARWPVDAFDKIVIDECHEIRYRNVLEYFKAAQYLGMTATPICDGGKKSLREFFNYPYIETLTLRQAMEGYNAITGEYDKPFLSRIKIQPINAEHIDLSGIKLVDKDFAQSELDKVIWEHTNFLASAIFQESGDRPTFVFTTRVHTADAIAAALRDMGGKAMSYTSSTPDPADVMRRFERGDLQYLVSVNMLVKGVNVRKVECIARVRASLNIAQATQEIGRGTRLCPETGKEDCLIIEFDFKVGKKHQLESSVDAILDGEFDPEVKPSDEVLAFKARTRERADKIIKSGEEQDVLKAIDRAKKELNDEDTAKAKAEAAAKAQAAAEARRAKYEKVDTYQKRALYDPLAGLDKVAPAHDSPTHHQAATPEQIARLAELSDGVVNGKRLSYAAAEKRIEQLVNRKHYKYASEKQLRMMIDTLGCDPREAQRMRKWEASKWIDQRITEYRSELVEFGWSWEQADALKPWQLLPALQRAERQRGAA